MQRSSKAWPGHSIERFRRGLIALYYWAMRSELNTLFRLVLYARLSRITAMSLVILVAPAAAFSQQERTAVLARIDSLHVAGNPAIVHAALDSLLPLALRWLGVAYHCTYENDAAFAAYRRVVEVARADGFTTAEGLAQITYRLLGKRKGSLAGCRQHPRSAVQRFVESLRASASETAFRRSGSLCRTRSRTVHA